MAASAAGAAPLRARPSTSPPPLSHSGQPGGRRSYARKAIAGPNLSRMVACKPPTPSARPMRTACSPAKTSGRPHVLGGASPRQRLATPAAHHRLERLVDLSLQRHQPLDGGGVGGRERVQQLGLAVARHEAPPLDAEVLQHAV